MELWADNTQVYELFMRVCTRWRLPPMGCSGRPSTRSSTGLG
ncbi:DUF1799 domain-containing protein [Comamonas sp. UBA7528]